VRQKIHILRWGCPSNQAPCPWRKKRNAEVTLHAF